MSIADKVSRIFCLYAGCLLLIFMRTCHLSTIQHETRKLQAEAPKKRVAYENVERATIRDRFNIPLALNKVQYNLTFSYAPLYSIPRTEWVHSERIFPRKDYISRLVVFLAHELETDPSSIEDKIHAEAALFPQTPFLLKENLSEKQYSRLKILEKDWPGIRAERRSKRVYPWGKTACDILGYIGPIDSQKYYTLAQEINSLENYFHQREEGLSPPLPKGFSTPSEVRARLSNLQEKAYTMHDVMGKAGIEQLYDAALRGSRGKSIYEVDKQGNRLKKLPGSYPGVPGQRVLLTISAELQQYAEEILIKNESAHPEAPPWIKGGAIVVMDPNTGEILALASNPRFDPNDFVLPPEERNERVIQCLESPSYIAQIWDGKRPLTRERFSEKQVYEEKAYLTWEKYIETILPSQNSVRKEIEKLRTLKDVILIQRQETPNKNLFIDLCHLLAPEELFSEELLKYVGNITPSTYRQLSQSHAQCQELIKRHAQKKFHSLDFFKWRKEHGALFIQTMRENEKERKSYTKPYTEYLNKKEKELFSLFWQEHKKDLLCSFLTEKPLQNPLLIPYINDIDSSEFTLLKETLSSLPESLILPFLETMRSFENLTLPLRGHYPALRGSKKGQIEKDLASAFYPIGGYGYGRSQAFRQTTPQGSPFKLVPAYQALIERYNELGPGRDPLAYNPLTLTDDFQWTKSPGSSSQILGYTLAGKAITRLYKNGRLPRSSHPHIGTVDLIGALEQSSNIYFSLLASEHISHPQELRKAAELFSFGNKTGIDLPGEIQGNVPEDIDYDKTGLYACAIGQHSLVATPLQTAVMLSALANRGKVLKPRIVHALAGKMPSRQEALRPLPHFPLQEPLSLIGIDFPLFTETTPLRITPQVFYPSTEIVREIPLPKEVRYSLLEGMRRTVQGSKGTGRPSIMRDFPYHPHAVKDYSSLSSQLIGKTGTAEIMYSFSIDPEDKATLLNHVWFSGISFPTNEDAKTFDNPELVVVVYLRFGGWGKEAAPLAAQLVKKWREIKNRPLA